VTTDSTLTISKFDSKFIDSHAHLSHKPIATDIDGVIKRAAAAGVSDIVTVGIDYDDAKAAIEIAENFDNVFCSIGYHPHNAKSVDDKMLQKMETLAAHPKVVGYGEIGLDFYWNKSPHDKQEQVFFNQLKLAKRLNKPVVIHLRDAYAKGLEMMESLAPYPAKGVIHCFSGNEDDARSALDLGFYISIPGILTFKAAKSLQTIASYLPEDRILLETDCPFLAPIPYRGKVNEPAYMVHTAEKLAQIRGISLDKLANITRENTRKVFNLKI